MPARTAIINVMAGACYKASRRLLRDFGEVEQLQVSRKGPGNFVATADRTAAQRLIGELSHARPDYGLLCENSDAVASQDPKGRRWIIDSLDGASNFLHGVPHWAISVAMEEDGEVVAGVVLDPARDELFWAEKGVGAYVNDRRIRVSERRHLSECLVAAGAPFAGPGDDDRFRDHLHAIMAETAGFRRFGAASLDLAYVAAGRCDGYLESGVDAWTAAAGIVLIREAGGYVTDLTGRGRMLQNGDVLAANARIHHRLLRLLKEPSATARAAGA